MEKAKVKFRTIDYQKALVDSFERTRKIMPEMVKNHIENGLVEEPQRFERYKPLLEGKTKINPYSFLVLDDKERERKIYELIEELVVSSILADKKRELREFEGLFNKMVIEIAGALGRIKEKAKILNEFNQKTETISFEIIKNRDGKNGGKFIYSSGKNDETINFSGKIWIEEGFGGVVELNEELSLIAPTHIAALTDMYAIGIRKVISKSLIGFMNYEGMSKSLNKKFEKLKETIDTVELITRNIVARVGKEGHLILMGMLFEDPWSIAETEKNNNTKFSVYESFRVRKDYYAENREGKLIIMRKGIVYENEEGNSNEQD